MNLPSLKDKLLDLGKRIGLQLEQETAQSISLHTNIEAKEYFEDTIYCNMVIYQTGTFHLFLTFGELERTYDNLYLINNFNDQNPWFRAYISNINDKDFLELHYAALAMGSEDEVVNSVNYLLNAILQEDTLQFLRPILKHE